MTPFLLDINVLIALFDDAHTHHEAAHAWWAKKGRIAWATCPLTENGFVRIASHPRYPNSPGDAQQTLALLREFCAGAGHVFWPDDVTLRDALAKGTVLLHSQVTDIYLLALAAHHDAKLATFDRHIQTQYIKRGAQAIEFIPA